jgi:CRISPR-associated protein Csd2
MIHLDPTKRHDFVLLFDVENANPNGDPDAGNLPRVDPDTMRGFTTDVSIKRKVRDYLQLTYGLPMFIQSETALNRLIFEAADEAGATLPKATLNDSKDDRLLKELLAHRRIENIEFGEDGEIRYVGESFKKNEITNALKSDVIELTEEDVKAVSDALIEAEDGDFKGKPLQKQDIETALKDLAARLFNSVGKKKKLEKQDGDNTRRKMIEKYFDIRLFGAVLSTGLNAGQVRGPVQLTFAKTLHPIFRMDCGITRIAVTKEADRKRKETEMGRKPIVSYGLYCGHGFYNPYLAQKTPKTELTSDNLHVTSNDLNYLWEALWKSFDNDHSASRHIRPRGLYVFTHACARGNAPSHRLFDMLKVELKKEVRDNGGSPSQFNDYNVFLPSGGLQVGSQAVEILPTESIERTESIPANAVVFTKIYHEDRPTD